MENFFKQVESAAILARQAKQESLKRGDHFNMFSICGVNHYENTHSAILAELLNPHGCHGQDTVYLSLFLISYNSRILFRLDEGAKVITEYATDEGRIDILITNPFGQAIIIENKIYAADQWEQLKRYDRFARQKYGEGNYEIIYLTLNGDEASEQSAEGVVYHTMSYAIDIAEWLEECIRYSYRLPLIRETLIQYQNHITNLTCHNMDNKELFETMMANAKETEHIIAAGNNGFLEYVFNCKVMPQIRNFAEENGLIAIQVDGIKLYFRRPEWKKSAILFTHEGGRHFYGVTSSPEGTLEDLQQLPMQQLKCMDDAPNDWWPYGSHYIKPHDDWSFGTGIITKMTDGTLVKHIQQLTLTLLKEIDDNNIKMI